MKPYYQDEAVTLYHGDCLADITEWLAADVLVTDPPYGIGWTSNAMHYDRTLEPTRDAVINDVSTAARDAALAFWGSRPALVFGTWKAPRPSGTRQRLIWHKVKQYPAMSTAPWFAADEEIYVLGAGFTGSPAQTVYQTYEARGGSDGLSALTGHPTPKPVPLLELLLDKCPSGVVADPFAGSGSTLVAARNLGRKAIGVEIEERYCEIAARRLAANVLDFGGVA